MKNYWIGIDYGSRKGGTTAVCLYRDKGLQVHQCGSKEDADIFIRKCIEASGARHVYIDAPLSLPGAYTGGKSDFFYRTCDRETGAMSPMFIGGLTARAMQLDAALPAVKFTETYPGFLAREILGMGSIYQKKLKCTDAVFEALSDLMPFSLDIPPTNWHQVDACLAWYSGWRHDRGESLVLGDPAEGVITV